MILEKHERFAIFVERLCVASPVNSAEEALALLANILNGVEEEFTTIPFNPEGWSNDGRMYAPMPDSARDVRGRTDLTRYRSRAHNTFIQANGAIRIESVHGDVVLEKPGSDGNEVNVP